MRVVLFSGGMDSTVALAHALQQGPAQPLFIAYGQRHHERELQAARAVCAHYGLTLRVAVMQGAASALTGEGDLSCPVVPARNLGFVYMALATYPDAAELIVGVHKTDHNGFSDCRPDFWGQLAGAVRAAYGTKLRTPLLLDSKRQVAEWGLELNAPLHLTWSCYAGGAEPCGDCGACREREKALQASEEQEPDLLGCARVTLPPSLYVPACGACQGSGKDGDAECPQCKGKGWCRG